MIGEPKMYFIYFGGIPLEKAWTHFTLTGLCFFTDVPQYMINRGEKTLSYYDSESYFIKLTGLKRLLVMGISVLIVNVYMSIPMFRYLIKFNSSSEHR